MTAEMIEHFIDHKDLDGKPVHIHFKERSTVDGIFVKGKDYDELKAKNFWRVLNSNMAGQWAKTKDVNLTRLFNGVSFTKLSENR
ncbi:MAG TPA: hypothetical protein VKR32_19860 [Puia sp.]|nr:hypothetical protein [Puia sp.]